jgi:hypothetical protein
MPFASLKRPRLAGAIAAAGVAVQLAQWIRARPLWLDEEMIALNVRDRSVGALAGALWLGQSAPLGWLTVERVLMLAAGQGERALRALPVFFGVATIVAAWWVGQRWLTPIAAAVLVLICSTAAWFTFHFFELKPYSADAFWGLLLPALAAWTAEPIERGAPGAGRRAALWWSIAAIGQWFGNGALLVTPFCAAVLVAAIWRRRGVGPALAAAAPGVVWAAAFALHFWLAMRFTWGSAYLHEYWATAMPAAGASAIDRVRWLAAQLAPLAAKPVSTGFATLFWAASLAGFFLATRVDLALRLAFLSVPVAAFLLAGLGLVPMYERLSLWLVPSLYVGVALCADAAVARARSARRRAPAIAFAAIVGSAAAVLTLDMADRGIRDLGNRPARSNHQLDDRAAIHWLMSRHEPGDVVLTTSLALPAVWWYAGARVAAPDLGQRFADGSPILDVKYLQPGQKCQPDALRAALAGHSRALVYFGFRFDDVPRWFDDLLLDRLAALGTLTAYRPFAERGRAAIFDLRIHSARPGSVYGAPDAPTDATTAALGCLAPRPALRW